jgi:excisionase family DNA binding protein
MYASRSNSPLDDKIALRIPEASYVSGLSRSTLYSLINEGKLRSIKAGRRRLILRTDLEAYFAQLLQEQQP